uniref:Uncharacterized protein n=1 Tax=Octactis speculum TaxID=3111310 RepID=A0A7S2BD43_9STRA
MFYNRASIAAATSSPGTLTAPSLSTRNLPLKFHPGSSAPVCCFISFHASLASGPFTSPLDIKNAWGGSGNLAFSYANAAMSAFVANSCPPNSPLGKARTAS